jgi:electron transfer flavoprotein alpha subunit
MDEILVVVEHRQGKVREITHQMLQKAAQLCAGGNRRVTAVLLGDDVDPLISEIRGRADRIVLFRDTRLAHFDPETFVHLLQGLLVQDRPLLVLMGHTPWGMDLAPALSIKSGLPLATDCVDIVMEDGQPMAVRQIYGGKLFSRVSLHKARGYLFTVRSGAFPSEGSGSGEATLEARPIPADLPEPKRRFLDWVDTGSGAVDITQADLLVSIGRGIGEDQHIPFFQELAGILGGALSCSRPVVDRNWLPKYHQVGTSGKSVRPKVYLAFGISGAFQHVAGITGAGCVIAINKDKKAPIFRVAHYGVVEDLFKIAEALKEKLASE